MTDRNAILPPPDEDLWLLVDAVAAGTATGDECARLESRLRCEESARQFYVAYLDLHAALQWRTRGATGSPPAAPILQRQARRLLEAPFHTVAAVCGVLALAVTVAVLLYRPMSEEGEPPGLADAPAGAVAVLIRHRGTLWDEDMTLPTATGAALPPGRLKLRAGVVEIAFRNGGDVLLEGPADFDVAAADRGFLHRGKLTAKVAGGASALHVAAPGLVVTDRGGECGLFRDDTGGTEVHVFEGDVGAEPEEQEGSSVRVAENTAARVDAGKRTLTPVPLNERAFARLRPEVRLADVSVRGGQFAGRNFGLNDRLVVKNSIPDYSWETYLRFDLSGVKGQISEAHVRLVPVFVGRPLDNAAAVVTDDRWTETTLTWEEKPVSAPPFARWTVEPGQVVDLDVTQLVQHALTADKKLSLRIFAPEYRRASSFVEYGSRKGDAAARPQLLLTPAP